MAVEHIPVVSPHSTPVSGIRMDTTQRLLDFEPCDSSMPDESKPRLSGQNGRILARLRIGRVTNDELAQIARKYTSRISDLRKAGHRIEVVHHNHSTGLVVYALKGEARA